MNATLRFFTHKPNKLTMATIPTEDLDWGSEFAQWCYGDKRVADVDLITGARDAWYAATAVILNKLEEQLETAVEFDNEFEADLLRSQIEFIQNEL